MSHENTRHVRRSWDLEREGARASDRKDMPVVPDRQEPDVKAKIRPALQGIRLPAELCERDQDCKGTGGF